MFELYGTASANCCVHVLRLTRARTRATFIAWSRRVAGWSRSVACVPNHVHDVSCLTPLLGHGLIVFDWLHVLS